MVEHIPYGSALTIRPSSQHTHSIIFLHGLGSNGAKFGTEFLETGVCSSGAKLTDLIPGAKFIFPTSKPRRSSAFRRTKLTQWFDIACLGDPSYKTHTQISGFVESYGEILEIITEEAAQVGPENIILGGLSQGCAMGLICLLAIDFPLAGFIGMSGWLPLQHEIRCILEDADRSPDDDDPFDQGDADDENRDTMLEVVSHIRDSLSIATHHTPTRESTSIRTPVFLGHGAMDEKVLPSLGEEAFETLKALGFTTEWRGYQDEGHWYKIPDEIDDIVDFIRVKVGWLAKQDT